MDTLLEKQDTDKSMPMDAEITNSKSKVDGRRNIGIERAARMKAAIIALLNNTEEPLSKSAIAEKLSDVIKELNYKTSNFESQLYQLVGNDLVKRVGKTSNNQGSLYASAKYQFPNPNDASDSEEPKQKRQYIRRKGVEDDSNSQKGTGTVPAISLDIVKSTGRVRLAINGMSIEIGVSDN
jgi:hypothetical protein